MELINVMLNQTGEVKKLNHQSMEKLEDRIGYCFRDKDLLRQALTHSSFSNEQKIRKCSDYERLEFLGDAVLELVTSEYLFHLYREIPEGELTKMRASMVCEPALAYCARDLELGDYIRLGRGEESTGGRERDSIIADVVEAVIGAIFLDSGLEDAKVFINRFVLNDIENKQLFFDSKSNLQELAQGQIKEEVSYSLLDESGPEHSKSFTVEVRLGGKALAQGSGKTKKAAEQQAAYRALMKLRDKGYVFKKY